MFFSLLPFFTLASQNLGANIRRVFALANGFKKIFRIVLVLLREVKILALKVEKISCLLIYLHINTTLFGQSTMQYKLSPADVFTIKQDSNLIIKQEIDGAIWKSQQV